MAISLLTLNIEGDKHYDKFIPVLQELNLDVICMQEVFEADCRMLVEQLGMKHYKYVPTMKVLQPNKYGLSPRGNWGILMMTNLEVKKWDVKHYSDFTELQEFFAPNDDVRTVIIGELAEGGVDYRIATTHFTWSPRGAITDLQRADFKRLQTILSEYEDLLLCGDFNAPRGREMFSLFTQLYTDNVPASVQTSIDPTNHYAGNLQLVVDDIFSTPHYRVSDVQMISGVSDHMGVLGSIDRL